MTVLLIGTYQRNGGAGLQVLRRADQGEWSLGPLHRDIRNASYGARSAEGIFYFVDEQDPGAVTVARLGTENCEVLARHMTHGAEPCYLALDPGRNRLAVANYASGSLTLFTLDATTGLPAGPPAVHQDRGRGPDPERQAAPHAHCVRFSPDGRWLYGVDLGTDEICAHILSPAKAALGRGLVALRAAPGSGPRHLAFHPTARWALLVCELASTLSLLEVADGRLIVRQTVSTLPEGFTGESLGGDLTLNGFGDRVYVTNRGHDTIAVFSLDGTGTLACLQHAPSRGPSPRSIALLADEGRLVVANEKGGTVVLLDILEDGTLSPDALTIDVPGAAFVLAAPDLGGLSGMPPGCGVQ